MMGFGVSSSGEKDTPVLAAIRSKRREGKSRYCFIRMKLGIVPMWKGNKFSDNADILQ
jgi:hypothetical protein